MIQAPHAASSKLRTGQGPFQRRCHFRCAIPGELPPETISDKPVISLPAIWIAGTVLRDRPEKTKFAPITVPSLPQERGDGRYEMGRMGTELRCRHLATQLDKTDESGFPIVYQKAPSSDTC
jgi:hypothetical protein